MTISEYHFFGYGTAPGKEEGSMSTILRPPVVYWCIMVLFHDGTWRRCGKPYRSKDAARSWQSFARKANYGLRSKVKCLTVRFNLDGTIAARSVREASEVFNLELAQGES